MFEWVKDCWFGFCKSFLTSVCKAEHLEIPGSAGLPAVASPGSQGGATYRSLPPTPVLLAHGPQAYTLLPFLSASGFVEYLGGSLRQPCVNFVADIFNGIHWIAICEEDETSAYGLILGMKNLSVFLYGALGCGLWSIESAPQHLWTSYLKLWGSFLLA